MPDRSPLPNRRSVRLPGFDYSRTGQYFVTICAIQKRCLFGRMDGSLVLLNDIGELVHRCWLEIPLHFPQISLDVFVVMPNHFHGILAIHARARHAVPALRCTPVPSAPPARLGVG
jgi:REP element-mobilizing transposase RayT